MIKVAGSISKAAIVFEVIAREYYSLFTILAKVKTVTAKMKMPQAIEMMPPSGLE